MYIGTCAQEPVTGRVMCKCHVANTLCNLCMGNVTSTPMDLGINAVVDRNVTLSLVLSEQIIVSTHQWTDCGSDLIKGTPHAILLA